MPLFGQTVSLAERKQALSNVMRERAEKRYVAANEVDNSSEGEAPLTKEQRSAEYELAVAARDMGLPKPPLQERVHESPLRVSDSGNRLVSKGPENGPPTTAVGLLHQASTQGCEALNGLAVRMTPKGLCVAFGRAAPARQAATVARFNDGMAASVGDVMKRLGARTGLMRASLERVDKTRSRHAERKESPWAKGLRKRAAASRRERTQAEDDGNGDGEYAPGMAF